MVSIIVILTLLLAPLMSSCQPEPTQPPPTPTPAPMLTPTPTPSLTSTPAATELEVHYIDVGQGDSILVDLGETEILIDGGDKSSGIVEYLKHFVDEPLEVMVATHPHADHIGGLVAVLDEFQVDQIWHNGDTSSSQTYAQFMAAVQAESAEVHVGRRGDEISVGELTFIILNPATLSGSTNNNSIVLSLSYGEVDFLFTGDAEHEAEAAMLIASDIPVPDIEILKVGHHGSRTASSQDFLFVTSPEVAIYMAGTGNRYGHPHEEIISNLNQVGAEIYGTDIHGTIVIVTDGESYTLQPENIVTPRLPAVVSPPSTPTPTPTPTSTPTPSAASNVQITRIFYDGVVPRVESDEYVEITNLSDSPQDLGGWLLKDISEGYPSFTFPDYILEPSATIRVYTDEVHPEWGGFSFGYGKAIWNNKEPDIAALYNAQGQEVSRKSY